LTKCHLLLFFSFSLSKRFSFAIVIVFFFTLAE
jgi:hypothetical protein